MLESRKSRLFERLFAVYDRNLFRRRFNSLRVSGLVNLTGPEQRLPVVAYANHSSWWDGLVAFEISRRAGLDSYVMMEEKQLARLRPFRWLGAFSVDRSNPRAAAESVRYAAELLRGGSRRAVWIFPQGEILPNDRRPLRFFSGISRLVRSAGPCLTVPVAMRFELLGDFKPDAFVRIGVPDLFTPETAPRGAALTSLLSERLTAELDSLKENVAADSLSGFEDLLRPGR